MNLEPEIKSILSEFGVSYQANSKSFILSCPKCRKTEKLYIRKYDGRFVCWYCKEIDNYQGHPEYVLPDLTSLTIDEVRFRLYGEVERVFDSDQIQFSKRDFLDDEESVVSSEIVLPEVRFPPNYFPITAPQSMPGVEYLARRGIPIDIAAFYGLAFSTEQQRVIFPATYQGKLYGWQGRTINPKPFYWDEFDEQIPIQKVLTSVGFKKDRFLMFRDRLVGSKHAVLCEGPVDGVKAHLCGGNIVTMGKAVSRTQLELIRAHGVSRVYTALDPDAAAEIRRIAKELNDLEVYDMRPKAAKDLGEMDFGEVKRLFDNAEPLDLGSRVVVYIKNHYGAINFE